MTKIIIMLVISIILNILSIIGQHLEDGEISGYQFAGTIFQIIVLILLF